MAKAKPPSTPISSHGDSVQPLSRRQFLGSVGVAGVDLTFGQKVDRQKHVMPAPATQRIKNAIPLIARPLPLTDVRLTGGPLKQSQDADAKYLLALKPDRMMVYFRKRAKLPTKGEGYGGWDGGGRNLTGHIAGHYLSAVSLMYAATGDPRFKQRADYLVLEFALVQDSDDYLGALMDDKNVDGKTRFEELKQGSIRSGGFDLRAFL